MKEISVCHFLWSNCYGGILRFVQDLSQWQYNNASNKVTIVFSKLRESYDNLDGAECGKVISLDMKNGYWLDKSGRLTVRDIVSAADIVHVHDYNPLVMSQILKHSKNKIIYTEHGNYGIGRTLRLTERINQNLFKRLTRHIKVEIVFNSWFSKEYGIKLYGPHLRDKKVIHNGIPTAPDILRPLNKMTDNEVSLLFVGRIVPQKGLLRFIDVLSLLKTSRYKYILRVVGSGPEWKRCIDYAETIGVAERIHFYGYQDNVDRFLSEAHIVVVPSFGEPFGLVAIEALRAGRPIVVYADGGGVVEIAEKIDEDCIATDHQDMARIIENYTCRIAGDGLETEAYTRVAEYFSLDTMGAAYTKVYNNVLSKNTE